MRRVRIPSPAVVVALLALAIAATGSVSAIRAAGEHQTRGGVVRPITVEYAESTVDMPRSAVADTVARCSEGYRVLSGGFFLTTATAIPLHSYPTENSRGWAVLAANPPSLVGRAGKLTAFAVCAKSRTPVVP